MADSLGFGRDQGGTVTDWLHCIQSIKDILTTPIGTRVMRRQYGCALHEFIDAPMNDETILRIIAAAADALDRWEPRFRLQRLIVDDATPGKMTVPVEGIYFPRGHLGDYSYGETERGTFRL